MSDIRDLAYEIQSHLRQIKVATDKKQKRQLSLALGELQHRLTLALKALPKDFAPNLAPGLTWGDKVAVLDRPVPSPKVR